MEHDPVGSIRRAWASALSDTTFRRRALVVVALAAVVLPGMVLFLARVQERPGAVLTDPVLRLFDPVDLSAATFALVYGGLIAGLLVLVARPDRLLLGLLAYVFVTLARLALMAATPLDPPATHVPLVDPFVGLLVGSGDAPTRDLFFSGHTSLAILLALVVPGARWRALFLAISAGLAALLLVQHVHYTVDVLVAPFAAYGCYRLAALALPEGLTGRRNSGRQLRGTQGRS